MIGVVLKQKFDAEEFVEKALQRERCKEQNPYDCMRDVFWRYDQDANILGKIIYKTETSIEDFQKEMDSVKAILERYIESPNVKIFSGLSYS